MVQQPLRTGAQSQWTSSSTVPTSPGPICSSNATTGFARHTAAVPLACFGADLRRPSLALWLAFHPASSSLLSFCVASWWCEGSGSVVMAPPVSPSSCNPALCSLSRGSVLASGRRPAGAGLGCLIWLWVSAVSSVVMPAPGGWCPKSTKQAMPPIHANASSRSKADIRQYRAIGPEFARHKRVHMWWWARGLRGVEG